MDTETVVSPSLLNGIDPDKPVPLDLRLGMKELLGVSVNPADYLSQHDLLDDEVDTLLLAASQSYKSGAAANMDYQIDDLLLAVSTSEQFESHCLPSTDTSYDTQCGPLNHFGAPQSAGKVEAVKKSRIPKKTQASTVWAENIWHEWATYRLKCLSQEERSCRHKLKVEITELDTAAVCFWLQRFVLEVGKGNGKHYCPDSLHQLCCGL